MQYLEELIFFLHQLRKLSDTCFNASLTGSFPEKSAVSKFTKLSRSRAERTSHEPLTSKLPVPIIAFAKYLLCPNHHANKEESKDCFVCNQIEATSFPELKIIEPDGATIKKEQLLEQFNYVLDPYKKSQILKEIVDLEKE